MKQNVTYISTLGALLGVAAVVITPFLLGCDTIMGAGDCTSMACREGVRVQMSGSVPNEFTIVLTPLGGEERVITCPPESGGQCGSDAFFENVLATDAVLHVRWAGGTISRQVRLEYERIHPNGPSCEPVCLVAELGVDF
jgi:hypothetical protein